MSDEPAVTILYRSDRGIARQPIPYGCLVRHDDDGCEPSGVETMTGVAKRAGIDPNAWQVGENVLIQIDGELRAELIDDVQIELDGVVRLLKARQPIMLQLAGGKIVRAW